MTWTALAGLALAMWVGLLLTPWRPWRMGEVLEPVAAPARPRLEDLTVLIPARDEAQVLRHTLPAVALQGEGHRIVLVDDESTDGTAQVALGLGIPGLTLLRGAPLEPGWSGKLWALEQALRRADTEWVLLLDADIELRPGMVEALRARAAQADLDMVSVMARLRMHTRWERLLLPAFVYFFKLLYPFALANRPSSRVAAAAGGCVLLRRERLLALGGFAALRGAIIDDCTLARLVKGGGGRTWTGVTLGAVSLRPYPELRQTWDMVARTAYTQLRYSPTLLLLCSLLMGLAFLAPLGALVLGGSAAQRLAAGALAAMAASYLPTLRYYGLSPAWALSLPAAATLYLAMTWTSALRYWRGERSRWKGRRYAAG